MKKKKSVLRLKTDPCSHEPNWTLVSKRSLKNGDGHSEVNGNSPRNKERYRTDPDTSSVQELYLLIVPV